MWMETVFGRLHWPIRLHVYVRQTADSLLCNDGHPAYLLINDGTGRFTDQTAAFGLAPKRHRRTYSASFVDLDEDRDLDLMVVSDFAGLDLYRNNGKGQFTDITDSLGANHYSFGMSHALADFDQDQKLDIYMVGMGSTTARRLESLGLGRPVLKTFSRLA